MSIKNIEKILVNKEEKKIKWLTDKDNVLPESCVIFPDGLCIEAKFGGHINSFVQGANLYLAKNNLITNSKEVTDQLEKLMIDDTTLNLSIKAIYEAEANHLVCTSLFGINNLTITLNDEIKEAKNNEHLNFLEKLKEIMNETFWIGSRESHSNPTPLVKEIAKNWLIKNGPYIWFLRVISYMIQDESFFEDNEYSYFKKEFKKFGIHLPTESKITKIACSQYGELRGYELINIFEKNFTDGLTNEKINEIINIFDNLSFYHEILEPKKPEYLINNITALTNVEFDKYQFYFMDHKTLGRKEANLKKQIEEIKSNTPEKTIKLEDNYINTIYTFKAKDIESITTAANQSEVYLKVKLPKGTRLLKKELTEPSIETLVLDKNVKIIK